MEVVKIRGIKKSGGRRGEKVRGERVALVAIGFLSDNVGGQSYEKKPP